MATARAGPRGAERLGRQRPSPDRRAGDSRVHPVDRGAQHRRAPGAHRVRGLRLVPAGAAALVVPLGLAAARPRRGHRRPVRRAAGPLAAPARDEPAVPDPDVGRGARLQRARPPQRRPGRALVRRLPDRRAAAADGPLDGRKRGLPGGPGADPADGRPRGRAGRAGAAQDPARGRRRRAGRAGLRGRAPRPGHRQRRARRPSGARRGDVLADAPLVLTRPARAAEHARGARRGLGARGPGQLHRRRRLLRRPVRADGDRPRPHRLQRRRLAAPGHPDRGADARPADPRGRRPVDPARRPAARRGRGVRADLRPAPRGSRQRAAAPDEQGAFAGQALHRRTRAGAAAVAVAAGRARAGDRRRDDVGLHRARHPRAVLVAAGGVRPDRA